MLHRAQLWRVWSNSNAAVRCCKALESTICTCCAASSAHVGALDRLIPLATPVNGTCHAQHFFNTKASLPASPFAQHRRFSTAAGNITSVETDEQFYTILKEQQGGAPCVVDFHAVWCGPCRQISPYFEQLAGQYPGLRFLKVDVDKVNKVAAEASINAVPAFQVWKDGRIVDEFVGASKEDLKSLCDKHTL